MPSHYNRFSFPFLVFAFKKFVSTPPPPNLAHSTSSMICKFLEQLCCRIPHSINLSPWQRYHLARGALFCWWGLVGAFFSTRGRLRGTGCRLPFCIFSFSQNWVKPNFQPNVSVGSALSFNKIILFAK